MAFTLKADGTPTYALTFNGKAVIQNQRVWARA
ncbi:MAG: hypothetical protein U5K54_06065 [Cytophagales bacterium]|nr:hypothetical protein [Cytophagales bacterium]